jgi:hypothetical protein
MKTQKRGLDKMKKCKNTLECMESRLQPEGHPCFSRANISQIIAGLHALPAEAGFHTQRHSRSRLFHRWLVGIGSGKRRSAQNPD